MGRLARVVAVGVPHHIAQRGNGRQFILTSDAERTVDMDLLRQAAEFHSLSVLGYKVAARLANQSTMDRKPSRSNVRPENHGKRPVCPRFSTGRDYDSETGLRYYRARYYDPSMGRFISEDPIRFAGSGTNFYAYTHNLPTLLVDPHGLSDASECCKNVGNVFTCTRTNSMAQEALKAAREWAKDHGLPADSLHNGAADAFRHCFWSCTMARYLGEYVAETIADAHEKEGNRNGQPHNEELMDRANNLVGRTCAAEDKSKNCWDACTDKYNQGRLFGLARILFSRKS